MPYKDQEKKREAKRAWYAANRERVRKKKHEWYLANKERCLANHKRWAEENKERLAAYRREKYAEKNGKNVKKSQMKKTEEKQMQVIAKMETCPKCGSPGALKVSGMYYLAGCSKPGCKYFVGRDPESGFASSGTTAAAAVEGWNELARELREELGEKAVPAPAAAEEEAGAADEPAVPTDQDEAAEAGESSELGEEAVEEEAEAAEEEESAEEEDGERSARFWLKLDGKWYFLDEGCEGCKGCAFNLAFGKRSLCGAVASEDFAHAATLCKAAEGVWRDNSEE